MCWCLIFGWGDQQCWFGDSRWEGDGIVDPPQKQNAHLCICVCVCVCVCVFCVCVCVCVCFLCARYSVVNFSMLFFSLFCLLFFLFFLFFSFFFFFFLFFSFFFTFSFFFFFFLFFFCFFSFSFFFFLFLSFFSISPPIPPFIPMSEKKSCWAIGGFLPPISHPLFFLDTRKIQSE